jgi:hypothetical protein
MTDDNESLRIAAMRQAIKENPDLAARDDEESRAQLLASADAIEVRLKADAQLAEARRREFADQARAQGEQARQERLEEQARIAAAERASRPTSTSAGPARRGHRSKVVAAVVGVLLLGAAIAVVGLRSSATGPAATSTQPANSAQQTAAGSPDTSAPASAVASPSKTSDMPQEFDSQKAIASWKSRGETSIGKYSWLYGDPKATANVTDTKAILKILNDVLDYPCTATRVKDGVAPDMIYCAGGGFHALCFAGQDAALQFAAKLVEYPYARGLGREARVLLGSCTFSLPGADNTELLLQKLAILESFNPAFVTSDRLEAF